MSWGAVAKFDPNDEGSKTYIPKTFYRTEGRKRIYPKILYTKTTYITLLSEKLRGEGSAAPSILHHCWGEISKLPLCYKLEQGKKNCHFQGIDTKT
ncbi:hypothetical protein Hanom_Chr01g00035101 [Helianthus anomalus]